MGVGTTIMQLRSRAGLTQEELANRLDPPLSHAAVAAWEAGKSKPRYKVLSQLSVIFNVPMSQLLDGEQVPHGAVMPSPSESALPGVAGVIQAPAIIAPPCSQGLFAPRSQERFGERKAGHPKTPRLRSRMCRVG